MINKPNKTIYKNFLIKQADQNDLDQIIQLLNKLPSKGFLSDCAIKFRQIFIKDLLKHNLGIAIFAKKLDTKKTTGYLLAIKHPLLFWCKLILTHPIIIGTPILIKKRKILAAKFLSIFQSRQYYKKNCLNFKWFPSNPKIARIIFIGVLPEFRGHGLGRAMYSFLEAYLKKEKCIAIESHIDPDNIASLKLHQQAGWHIQKMTLGDYKAVLKL